MLEGTRAIKKPACINRIGEVTSHTGEGVLEFTKNSGPLKRKTDDVLKMASIILDDG